MTRSENWEVKRGAWFGFIGTILFSVMMTVGCGAEKAAVASSDGAAPLSSIVSTASPISSNPSTLSTSPAQSLPPLPPDNALASYIARCEDGLTSKLLRQRPIDNVMAYRLEYTSQKWRERFWTHQMIVVRPKEIRNPDIALLLISGDGEVDQMFDQLQSLAKCVGAVAAGINHVPNQPLYEGLKEDGLIAYTFDQYSKTGDRTWPLLFPMVKSAVRGMDVLQSFARQEFNQKIERFVVTGASKRGWTTWLTAAVDSRVAAIAPRVFDMLNMKAQTKWSQQMYGRQSEKIKDYTDLNLTDRMDEPRMSELLEWVDPYTYRSRFTMPKLILIGTNDPYWVVDSQRHYWDELPGTKLIYQTPGAGHDLRGGHEAHQTLAAFFQSVADRKPIPQMRWSFTSIPVSTTNLTGDITIEASLDAPSKAFHLWTALSPVRDFRKATWSSEKLPLGDGTRVSARIRRPAQGFRAFLIEAEMAAPTGETYKLSTEARVIPDGPPKP